MKAVFPCKGVVVLTKKDIQTLENFYHKQLKSSKMSEMYDATQYMVQVGNLNYLPPKSKLFVNEESLLTTSQLRSIMDNSTVVKKDTTNSQNLDNEISDDDILSHPFFQTLKPLN